MTKEAKPYDIAYTMWSLAYLHQTQLGLMWALTPTRFNQGMATMVQDEELLREALFLLAKAGKPESHPAGWVWALLGLLLAYKSEDNWALRMYTSAEKKKFIVDAIFCCERALAVHKTSACFCYLELGRLLSHLADFYARVDGNEKRASSLQSQAKNCFEAHRETVCLLDLRRG